MVLTKAWPPTFTELNTCNMKLISASENFSSRYSGQKIAFFHSLIWEWNSIWFYNISNAILSFNICMGNRHVRNLAASLMCCPMVTHPIHTLVSAIRCICNCICICIWVCVCVCNTYYILCIGIAIFISIWICRCIFVSFLNVSPSRCICICSFICICIFGRFPNGHWSTPHPCPQQQEMVNNLSATFHQLYIFGNHLANTF